MVEIPTVRTAGDSTEMVRTSKPTTLLCREICDHHRATYHLTDWIHAGDWAALQDVARASGYTLLAADLITVQFMPLYWTPKNGLELSRN